MFPYEPTTLDNEGDHEQCPNAGNGPTTMGGAGHVMPGSTSLQPLGLVEWTTATTAVSDPPICRVMPQC